MKTCKSAAARGLVARLRHDARPRVAPRRAAADVTMHDICSRASSRAFGVRLPEHLAYGLRVNATRAATLSAFRVAPRAACAAQESFGVMGDGAIQLNSWQSVENLILRPPRSVDGASIACFRMDVEARAHSERSLTLNRPLSVFVGALTRGLTRALRSGLACCAARS